VKRTLWLSLGRFGRDSLTVRAAAEHLSPDALVSRAAAYLEREIGGNRAALRLPRGLPPSDGQPTEVQVELTRAQWGRLEEEARRRGVGIERLLEHAVLLYVADLESGRLAETVLRRAEDET
jgi:hypothetical protein